MKHAHPIVAAIYDRLDESAERQFLAALRRRLLTEARGRVLEVGAGTGRNFAHYPHPEVKEVVAVEPDPHMRRRAEARVAAAAVPIRLTEGTAESLPVPDGSIDVIVSTLVLCSVDEPDAAIGEWRRVLRPRGSVLLIEHMRSDVPSRARIQDLLTPVWRRIAANCHLNRRSLAAIDRGGFEFHESERLAVGAPWVQPIVAGTARMRGAHATQLAARDG